MDAIVEKALAASLPWKISLTMAEEFTMANPPENA